MKTQIKPKKIGKTNDGQLKIEWDDQSTSTYDLKTLRFACPCATCVDEWTGKKSIKLESIHDEIKLKRIHSIGLYALAIEWSDSHQSGIYGYDYLYSLS